jgi:hypothetical protein
MKTLEYLKIKIFNNIENDFETKYGLFSNGYDNGYFQCQEDMADKIQVYLSDKDYLERILKEY